jgi:hypothetical protein
MTHPETEQGQPGQEGQRTDIEQQPGREDQRQPGQRSDEEERTFRPDDEIPAEGEGREGGGDIERGSEVDEQGQRRDR